MMAAGVLPFRSQSTGRFVTLADACIGLGLNLARQVTAEELVDEAYAQGILSRGELLLYRIWGGREDLGELSRLAVCEVLLDRVDNAWFEAQLRARLLIRDAVEGVVRVGTESGERALRHGASLLRIWMRAEIGRARRKGATLQ